MSTSFSSSWRLCRHQCVLRKRAGLRLTSSQARAISQGAQVEPVPVRPLAFDLHEPATPKTSEGSHPPIIFLHGLFGSKKNNRGISRCDSS